MFRSATLAVLVVMLPTLAQGQISFEQAKFQHEKIATEGLDKYILRRKHAAKNLNDAYKRRLKAAHDAENLEKANQITAEMKAFQAREKAIWKALSQAPHAEPDREADDDGRDARRRRHAIERKATGIREIIVGFLEQLDLIDNSEETTTNKNQMEADLIHETNSLFDNRTYSMSYPIQDVTPINNASLYKLKCSSGTDANYGREFIYSGPRKLTLTRAQASEIQMGDLYVVTGEVQLQKTRPRMINGLGHTIANFTSTNGRLGYGFVIVNPTVDLKKRE